MAHNNNNIQSELYKCEGRKKNGWKLVKKGIVSLRECKDKKDRSKGRFFLLFFFDQLEKIMRIYERNMWEMIVL